MGAVVKMSKTVKCYNYNRTLEMLGIKDYDGINMFVELLRKHEVEIFQPPYCKRTSGPTRRPEHYIKTNKWFDEYMKGKNLFSVIQGGKQVKSTYKKYDEKKVNLFVL